MTDRVNALLVTLEEDIREDDVKTLIEAISHFRWVLSVEKNIVDPGAHIAELRAHARIKEALWKALADSLEYP